MRSLAHTALISDAWRRNAGRAKDAARGGGAASGPRVYPSVAVEAMALAALAQLGSPQPGQPVAKGNRLRLLVNSQVRIIVL